MIEVYKHRKNPRVRLYKDESAPLPKHAHKDAWELLRTQQSVDSDAAQQMKKQGFALARVNLQFDEVSARTATKGAPAGRAGARPGRPGGQPAVGAGGARPARPGKPGGAGKGQR